jgi:hypothetical protein
VLSRLGRRQYWGIDLTHVPKGGDVVGVEGNIPLVAPPPEAFVSVFQALFEENHLVEGPGVEKWGASTMFG